MFYLLITLHYIFVVQIIIFVVVLLKDFNIPVL